MAETNTTTPELTLEPSLETTPAETVQATAQAAETAATQAVQAAETATAEETAQAAQAVQADQTAAPEITLTTGEAPTAPAPTEEAAQTAVMTLEDVQKEIEAAQLTPQEQQQVEDFSKKIDVTNIAQIMQYGAGTQKKMADFSDAALENVKAQDLGEVGDLLTNVVGELKGFDVDGQKGLFGFFKKEASKLETLKNRYDKAENNVDKIADALQQHQVRLLKDSAMLDQMYAQNQSYFKELSMYILAGKKRLVEVRNGDLKELEDKAKASGLPEDAQAAKDLGDKCTRFEKKIYDLELTRQVSLQTAPQIRLVQNNDSMMADKIQTTLVNTIPLWKSQMVLALGIEHSTEAAKAQQEVSDVTNELLKKNAEKLHMASVETAKESERGIIDIETVKQTNAELIQTLNDVLAIQKEGKEKRQAAEAEMTKMESDLKAKLLEIQK